MNPRDGRDGAGLGRSVVAIVAVAAVVAVLTVRSGPAFGGAAPLPVDPAALPLQSLAASCAACHGTDGVAPPEAPVPGLAGRPADELLARLRALRAMPPGGGDATVMPQLLRGYRDEQLQALARWFASRPR